MRNVYAFAIGAISMGVVRLAGGSFWLGLLLGVLIITAVIAIRDES